MSESRPLTCRPADWVRSIVGRIFLAARLPEHIAGSITEAVVEAHLRGVETHGLRRVRPYVARIQSGAVVGNGEPIIQTNGAFLRIDGSNGVGHYIGSVAADAVATVASTAGIAIAAIRNSNHFGFAGFYATRIASHDQIGIVVSNGQVCVGPSGARKALFSNNPLAIAAPTGNGDAFMELDLAMSATSRANIVEAAHNESPIPAGWAQDTQGLPTIDAKAALAGSLLPISGSKGFGLLVALEALTGVLAGGAYADLVASKEGSPTTPEGTCHTMIAIDLAHSMSAEQYSERLCDMFARIAMLPMRAGAAQPRHPGKRRWRLRKDRLSNGVPIQLSDLEDIISLAHELKIEVP